MRQGVHNQEPSPGLGVHSPQASPLQADRQLDSSSSEAPSPASNGCWTAVYTITGTTLAHLQHFEVMQCSAVQRSAVQCSACSPADV